MTLSIELIARAAMLDGFETRMVAGTGQASLTLLQTNLVLCVFNLGVASTGVPFGAAASDSIALSSTLNPPISSVAAVATGNANRFVIANQDPVTQLSGTVSGIGGGGDIQAPALTVTLAATQRLNSFTIRMSSTGQLSVEASLTLI